MLVPVNTADHHPFNQYVFNLCQQSAANSALTQLREQQTFNINLVLYAIWYGIAQHGRLQKNHWRELLLAVYPWHEHIIIALQRLQKLASRSNNLKMQKIKRLLQTEIAQAEKVEQQLLVDTLTNIKTTPRHEQQQLTDACFNIINYCKFTAIRLFPQHQQMIYQLLQVSFPNIVMSEIMRIFKLAMDTAKFSELSITQLRLENI